MTIKTIDARTLKKWLDNKEAILIDVREPMEYAGSHIMCSKHIPLSQVSARSVECFKGKKLVFHCKLGKRGAHACEVIAKSCPDAQVYNLEGGIEAWRSAGFPTEKGNCSASSCGWFTKCSIEDQARTIIGAIIVLFIALGYYVSPAFFWITGLVGVVMIISGITGACMIRCCLGEVECGHKPEDAACMMPTPMKITPAPSKTMKKKPAKKAAAKKVVTKQATKKKSVKKKKRK